MQKSHLGSSAAARTGDWRGKKSQGVLCLLSASFWEGGAETCSQCNNLSPDILHPIFFAWLYLNTRYPVLFFCFNGTIAPIPDFEVKSSRSPVFLIALKTKKTKPNLILMLVKMKDPKLSTGSSSYFEVSVASLVSWRLFFWWWFWIQEFPLDGRSPVCFCSYRLRMKIVKRLRESWQECENEEKQNTLLSTVL